MHGRLNLARKRVDAFKVGAVDLDTDRRADAGREHVGARLDRHGPGVADPRHAHRRVHLGDQGVNRHAGGPLRLRLEVDDGLEHFDGGRVGRRLCPARLAEDAHHFREAAEDAVLGLEQFGRFGDRQARQGDGHVEQRALVQRRHELAAEVGERPGRDAENDKGKQDGQSLCPQHAGNDRPIEPDEQPVHRISALGQDAAADEQQHQHRDQRHRQ